MAANTTNTVAIRPNSFTRKQLAVTFNIELPDGTTQSLTLEANYRIRATIENAGMSTGSLLSMDIYGMNESDMNALSYVPNFSNVLSPRTINQSNSTVIVRAGDYGAPLSTVFMGQLTEAYGTFDDSTSIFHLKAQTTVLLAANVPPVLSYSGPRSVASILSDICVAAGCQLIDHGGWERPQVLTNAYLEGSSLQQIKRAVKDSCHGTYNASVAISNNTSSGSSFIRTIDVWGPQYGAVLTDEDSMTAPLISYSTGLIGYPQYNRNGVSIETLFRPDIAYYQPIKIDSKYTPAGWKTGANGLNAQGQKVSNRPWDGIWLPTRITHELSAEMPNGPWHTYAECQLVDMGKRIAQK